LKFAKSTLTGAGAVVLAGLILALLAPKAAHAIVATAVQVENTVASPVVSQSILPGTPFAASCNVIHANSCVLSPSTPAGYTFHATYFSQIIQYSAGSNVPEPDALAVSYFQNGQFISHYDMAALAFSAGTAPNTVAAHPVDWYIDPLTNINTGYAVSPVETSPPTPASRNGNAFSFTATVSGYLTH
jgi:hypothetical protein